MVDKHLGGDLMDMLSTTISRAAETIPGAPNVAFPDVGDLMPFFLVCLVSLAGTALWLLALGGYVSRRPVRLTP